MPFITELMVQETPDNNWQLTADLEYQGRDKPFTIPQGFETDFASVPQLFLWLIPRSGRYTKAAVLHDWLGGEVELGRMTRCDADGIFRRAMREFGVSKVRRWLMWAAVRVGGLEKLRACGLGAALVVLAILAPLLIPAIVVGVPTLVLLAVVYAVEWAVYSVDRLRGGSAQRPTFIWWALPGPRQSAADKIRRGSGSGR